MYHLTHQGSHMAHSARLWAHISPPTGDPDGEVSDSDGDASSDSDSDGQKFLATTPNPALPPPSLVPPGYTYLSLEPTGLVC